MIRGAFELSGRKYLVFEYIVESVRGAKDGIKRAIAVKLARSMPPMKFLDRDFIPDGARFFAIFHDKQKSSCVFAVNTGSAWVKFNHELVAAGGKCDEVLASGRLRKTARPTTSSCSRGPAAISWGLFHQQRQRGRGRENLGRGGRYPSRHEGGQESGIRRLALSAF